MWTNFIVYSCYSVRYIQLPQYSKGVKIIAYKKYILLALSGQGKEGQKAVIVQLVISLKSIVVFARYCEDISVLTVVQGNKKVEMRKRKSMHLRRSSTKPAKCRL